MPTAHKEFLNDRYSSKFTYSKFNNIRQKGSRCFAWGVMELIRYNYKLMTVMVAITGAMAVATEALVAPFMADSRQSQRDRDKFIQQKMTVYRCMISDTWQFLCIIQY